MRFKKDRPLQGEVLERQSQNQNVEQPAVLQSKHQVAESIYWSVIWNKSARELSQLLESQQKSTETGLTLLFILLLLRSQHTE